MSEIKTIKIKIWGIVQGVGFRPFVAKLADRLQMKGEVLNIGGLVDIVLTDTQERIEAFIEALKREKPLPAEIVHIKIEEQDLQKFGNFTILDSEAGDDEAAMIPADLAICPDCLAEMQDPENPRYLHPFISCMVCGPRYSLIDKIPYDRENTSMIDFPMCDFCHGEYTDRRDRRYHAQTISCHDCGPMLEYCLSEEEGSIQEAASIGVIGLKADEKIMERAVNPVLKAVLLISDGKIIALKGVGGYYFVCSPFDERAVKNLRQLKVREEKPFAVMFRNIDQIKKYCHISAEEEVLLLSRARPIVLLERLRRPERKTVVDSLDPNKVLPERNEISPEVYKTSRYLGAFLPSMGVQHMLIDWCGPLIMTSANLSDMPIIKDDEEMFRLLDWRSRGPVSESHMKNHNRGFNFIEPLEQNLLSAVFYNERKIRIRSDDSVVRVIDGQPQMIRRSKGYAPVPLYINDKLTKDDMIFAAGGQLKSSFALSKGPFSYVSQYFGDQDSRETETIYAENVKRMAALFRIQPRLVVCDLHPLYFTTKYSGQYADQLGIELLKVQHHHAHVASVMAEHNLRGPVIGVSFDGTGYGTDGAIWGGEFLICQDENFYRAGHLEYIEMLGGDSSMKEGWKSALCYLYRYRKYGSQDSFAPSGAENICTREPIDPRWPMVKAGLEHRINTINSSSMGRLFDAMAAYIGIHDYNRYEGECAVMLENAAAEALEKRLEPWKMEFEIINRRNDSLKSNDTCPELLISSKSIFQRTEEALSDGINREQIALGFHYAVADMILQVCRIIRQNGAGEPTSGINASEGLNTVALTGGVFQNKILMERTLKLLRGDGFHPYYNISVSPNDGGICLGQNYIGMKYLTKKQHNVNIE